jgi:DNA-binding transcriptional ArsR family regulator
MTSEAQTPDREERAVVLSDPKAIRALAHGVRLQVIEELFDSDGTYTATDLGHKFGLTPSAMSYHLRSLERWGLVVRAEGTGDGRERHWRPAGTHLTIDTSGSSGNPAALSMMDLQLNQLRDRLSRLFMSRRAPLPPGKTMAQARRLPTMVQGAVYLTPDEREQFADEVWALIARFRKTTQEGAEAAAEKAGGGAPDVEKYEYFLSFVQEGTQDPS